MLSLRHRRFAPLILLFAWLQAMAPSMAAIVDGRMQDERTPYAHVESDASAGCVVVHDHHCTLCTLATSSGEITSPHPSLEALSDAGAAFSSSVRVAGSGSPRAASQRAPPAVRG